MILTPVKMQAVREEQGLSRSKLARMAELQPTMITWIETGRFVPYPAQLDRLARVLDVSDPEELLEPLCAGVSNHE